MATMTNEAFKLFNQAAACAALIGAALAHKNVFNVNARVEFLVQTGPNNTEKYDICCDFSQPENRAVIQEAVLPVAKATLERLSSLEEGAIQPQDLPNLPFTKAVLDAIEKSTAYQGIFFTPEPPSQGQSGHIQPNVAPF